MCDYDFSTFSSFVYLADTSFIESSTNQSLDFVLMCFGVLIALLACFTTLVIMLILLIVGVRIVLHLIGEAEARLDIKIKQPFVNLLSACKKRLATHPRRPRRQITRSYDQEADHCIELNPSNLNDEPPMQAVRDSLRWPRSSSNY